MSKYVLTANGITIFHNGIHQAATTNPRLAEIKQLAKEGKFTEAIALVNVKAAVEDAIKGTKVTLRGNNVYYGDQVIHSVLAKRIVELSAVDSAEPLVLFLENLMENPSLRAVEELYGFLEASNLPITEDGHFLAYKSVRDDFTDHHTGTMDNSVGAIVEMPRNQVDEDKDRTCSRGLHFAAHEYAKNFGGGRMVVLKINPKDVVAIPSDYNNQKGRACRYEIIEEVARTDTKLVGATYVNTGTAKCAYVPKELNFDDGNWDYVASYSFPVYVGSAEDFPVNRKVSYDLCRDGGKTYNDFYFTNYDEKHDNLVFRKFNGVDFDYVTVKDISEWTIETSLARHEVESGDLG